MAYVCGHVEWSPVKSLRATRNVWEATVKSDWARVVLNKHLLFLHGFDDCHADLYNMLMHACMCFEALVQSKLWR